jgi:hypothetical protein
MARRQSSSAGRFAVVGANWEQLIKTTFGSWQCSAQIVLPAPLQRGQHPIHHGLRHVRVEAVNTAARRVRIKTPAKAWGTLTSADGYSPTTPRRHQRVPGSATGPGTRVPRLARIRERFTPVFLVFHGSGFTFHRAASVFREGFPFSLQRRVFSMTAPINPDEQPLPPASNDVVIATPDFVSTLGPDSYQPLAGAPGFLLRSFDLAKATGGRFEMVSLKADNPTGSTGSPWHIHSADQIEYVLEGWVICEFEGIGVVRLEKGTGFYEAKDNRHRQIEASPDFVSLQIIIPAEMTTTFFTWDDSAKAYQNVYVESPWNTGGV